MLVVCVCLVVVSVEDIPMGVKTKVDFSLGLEVLTGTNLKFGGKINEVGLQFERFVG